MATAQIGAQCDAEAKGRRTEYAQADTKSQELSQNEHDANDEQTGTMGQSKIAKTLTTPRYEKERKIGHRRVDDTGQVTYKKKPTSELMTAMQLGIGQSITSLSSKPKRDLLLEDFSIVETVVFPREGSNLTPAHHYSDFRFKTYAPIAFRYFRELFSIQPDDFLLSMCNEPMLELSNPGASGSIFYISADDEFIIKTVQHKEADFLQKLLPGYYMNLNQNPRTLLPKFYGLYCYQCGGKNIRFVVMNNLLPSSIKIHEKYDLKGSTYKRKASKHERAKKSPTLKDLDFIENHPEGLMLEADTYTALIKTIERDCRVLQSFKIMDYSLLLGIHNLDQVAKEKEQQQGSHGGKGGDSRTTQTSSQDDPKGVTRGRSVRQRVAQYSTAMEAIQARADPLDLNDDDIPPGGIPARNSKGERLLLYLGVIDILQNYWLKKRLEHAVKSMVTDGDTISVHRPGFYAQRFQNFFRDKVFKKISSLDQPQVKGPHMRFKKMVQLALRQSPSKKPALTTKARTLTDVEGRIAEKYMSDGCNTNQPHYSDHGEVGGRPDLLPANATPPRLSLDGSQYTYKEQRRNYSTSTTRPSVVMTSPCFQSEVNTGSAAIGPSLTDRQPSSPAPSFSESTPTHTEYTEGTPSFTTSSASVYSDMLDSTPVLPSRSGTSRHSDHVAADLGQVQVELHEQATTNNQETTADAAASSDPQTSGSKSPDHSTDLRSDTDKQDAVSSRQNSSSLPQCNHHDEEPESETTYL